MTTEIAHIDDAHDKSWSLPSASVVYVVEQDNSLCGMLRHLLNSAGVTVCALVGYTQFWKEWRPQIAGCLIISPQAGEDGAALLRKLAISRHALPVIYFGPCADVHMAVQAMKAGALDFLVAPADPGAILAAVSQALIEDHGRRRYALAAADIAQRYARLSRREGQVFSLVVTGLMNKHMAQQLCLSESSIKIHRSNVMRKMGARTLVDLVHMNELLGMGGVRNAKA